MNIKHIIKGKVHAVQGGDGIVFDEENNHIVDVRSWGRLQYEKNGEEQHDFLTAFVVDAINEKLERGDELPRGVLFIGGARSGTMSVLVDAMKEVVEKSKINEIVEFIVEKPPLFGDTKTTLPLVKKEKPTRNFNDPRRNNRNKKNGFF